MMDGSGGFGMWGPGFGGIFMILFWGLIIVGIVALVKFLMPPSGEGTPRRDPVDILEERYARGEIDREEFESRRRDLEI